MRTCLPETRFEWSPETEVERVAFTARTLADGFYQRKRFVVAPELKKHAGAETVVMPQADYKTIDGFWEKISHLERSFPLKMSTNLAYQMQALLTKTIIIDPKILQHSKTAWLKVEDSFWLWLEATLPQVLLRVERVEVRLTRFGTVGSFDLLTQDSDQVLVVYWRLDQPLAVLAEVILTGLLQPLKDRYWFSWGELEATVDLLLTESSLADIFPGHNPTVGNLKQVSQERLAESDKYLRRLGVPTKIKGLELNGRRLYLNGKPLTGLTEREEQLMVELLRREGDLVGFDEALTLLWGREEAPSLWALNKTVQRLRSKLEGLGINGECLKTVRKRGYVWNV